MKYFLFLILSVTTTVDPKNENFFPLLDSAEKFSSTLQEKMQWSSETHEYCFLEKELSYFLQYEFSPVPIPAFKIKNGLFEVYISVDVDSAHPIQFQKLTTAWSEFSRLSENEKICFDGAYIPANTSTDAAYIMIDKIKSNHLELSLEDYWVELD